MIVTRRRATRVIAGAVLCAMCTLSGVAQAHPGHGDELGREQAVARALAEVRRLAAAGKIDRSWQSSAMLESADLRDGKVGREWAVVFSNPSAQKPDQSRLYVFLGADGAYLAANFTGL
jgi:hypothetical protein